MSVLKFADFALDRSEWRLDGPAGSTDLGKRSLEILDLLLSRPGRLVSKSDIQDVVWSGQIVGENALQAHISALRKALGPDLITTVHGRGYIYAGPRPQAASAAQDTSTTKKVRLFVGAIDTLRGTEAEARRAQNLTDDILDVLARYRNVDVLDARLTPPQNGFLITGKLGLEDGRCRLSLRLIELSSGKVLWADVFDHSEAGGAQQMELAAIVAGHILARLELELSLLAPAQDKPAPFLNIVKGIWHFRDLTLDANYTAMESLRRAIEEDPRSAEAQRWLACCYNSLFLFRFEWTAHQQCIEHARRGLELDPANAGCHAVMGFSQMWVEGLEAARETYAKALRFNPHDPHILADTALFHAFNGDFAASRDALRKARETHPMPPLWYDEFGAMADFAEGNYAAAYQKFKVVDGAWDMMYALSCCGHSGEREEAQEIKARFDGHSAQLSLREAAAREPHRDGRVREALIAGIEKALR